MSSNDRLTPSFTLGRGRLAEKGADFAFEAVEVIERDAVARILDLDAAPLRQRPLHALRHRRVEHLAPLAPHHEGGAGDGGKGGPQQLGVGEPGLLRGGSQRAVVLPAPLAVFEPSRAVLGTVAEHVVGRLRIGGAEEGVDVFQAVEFLGGLYGLTAYRLRPFPPDFGPDVDDHQPFDGVRIRGGVRHRDEPAHRVPQQREPLQPDRRREACEVGHEVLAGVVLRPVGVAVAPLIEGDDAPIVAQAVGELVEGVHVATVPVQQHERRGRRVSPIDVVQSEAV